MSHTLLTSCQSCTLSCCSPCLVISSPSPVLPFLSFPASPVLSKETFNNVLKRPSPSGNAFFYKDKNLGCIARCDASHVFVHAIKSLLFVFSIQTLRLKFISANADISSINIQLWASYHSFPLERMQTQPTVDCDSNNSYAETKID